MDMLSRFFKAAEYTGQLGAERTRRQPASTRGLSHCARCGYCCFQRTCVPVPAELPAIATYLGLTVPELVQRYMVGDEQGGHRFLRFANTAQTDMLGAFLDADRTFDVGQCLLFDEEARACRIYEARPQEARTMACWEKHHGELGGEHWQEGDLERLCPDMPEADEDWEEGEETT